MLGSTYIEDEKLFLEKIYFGSNNLNSNKEGTIKLAKLFDQAKMNPDLYVLYFLWPIVIAPKEIQFIIICLLLFNLLRRHKLYFDIVGYLMIVFMAIYLFSIVYNLIFNQYELERIVATINTFSIWLFALLFYLIFKVIHVDFEEIKKAAYINYCILIIIWLCSLIVYLITKTANFSILNKMLYYNEWFDDRSVIRFVGFMDYPNLIIMFFMFFYPLFLLYLRNFKNGAVKVLLAVLGLLPILTTFSRSGYAVAIAYLFLLLIYHIYHKVNRKFFVTMTLFATSSLIFLCFYTNLPNYIVTILYELFNAREGSNESRTYLMRESIRMTLMESPLIGMGVKETSAIGYPLGSHSTYVGFFYKTGIIGFILGCTIFITIGLKIIFSVRSKEKTVLKIALFMMLPLLIVEDIDGSNWLIVMYFLLVAIVFNKTANVCKERPT